MELQRDLRPAIADSGTARGGTDEASESEKATPARAAFELPSL